MADVKENDLRKSIKGILKGADLDSLSAKKIRRMLEEKFKADFTDRKDEIDKLVMEMITEGNESANEDEKESKQTIKNGQTQPAANASQQKQTKKDKKEKVEVKEESEEEDHQEDEELDDDNDSELDEVPGKKRKTTVAPPVSKKKKSTKKLDDEELAKKLQDEELDTRPNRRCKLQPSKPKQPKQKKERTKGTSLYSRPCAILPPLTKVLGTDRMPRSEVVKRLWEIAKERNLQDPSNKQFMLCDEEMQELFGRKKVRLFGMMKLLKQYIKDIPKE